MVKVNGKYKYYLSHRNNAIAYGIMMMSGYQFRKVSIRTELVLLCGSVLGPRYEDHLKGGLNSVLVTK